MDGVRSARASYASMCNHVCTKEVSKSLCCSPQDECYSSLTLCRMVLLRTLETRGCRARSAQSRLAFSSGGTKILRSAHEPGKYTVSVGRRDAQYITEETTLDMQFSVEK